MFDVPNRGPGPFRVRCIRENQGDHEKMSAPERCAIRSGGESWLIAAVLSLALAVPVTGQSVASASDGTPATRQQLQTRLEQLQEVVSTRPQDKEARQARQRIEAIERRLEHGDFRVGDVVRMAVRSDSTLTGAFRVNEQQTLELPTLPDVDLRGLLYAEADSAIRGHLRQYLRDPDVSVQVTRRIAILGAVQQPGFYDLPPTTTLSDALMEAGGPTGNAKLEDIELRRNGQNVLEGRDPSLQTTTLADLGPSRDDQLVVPQEGSGFGTMDALGVLSAVTGVVWGITRIF